MTAKRNGPTKRNGSAGAPDTIRAVSAFLASPGAAGLMASQKLALEAARFWARRMRAYADQLDALAGCADPMEVVAAQTRFVERMQEDYAAERRAMAELMKPPPETQETAAAETQA